MKRLVLALGLSAVGMAASVGSASAASWCEVDPLLGVGLPVTYNVNVSTSLLGVQTSTQLNGTQTTTHFATGFKL